jgi:beta-barrel assembly-enhancing protease
MKIRYLAALCIILLLPLRVSALTLDEERKYGKEMFLQIARSAPINNDPYVSLYVQTIKDRLEPMANLPFPITLTIIDSKGVDAFATIGGYVFVTTTLVGMCDNEEELAGVLAHEFAHVGKRHIAKRMEKEKYINWGSLATLVAAALAGGDPKTSSAILVSGLGSAQALSLKYSREDEAEADRVGGETADKAGYNPEGVAAFLKKLRANSGEREVPEYLMTHPYDEARIVALETRWAGSKTTVDTAFFPYVAVRTKVLGRQMGAGIEEIWLGKYLKDRTDPQSAYAASLIYTMKGNTDDSLRALNSTPAGVRNLFLGDMLVSSQKFKEAIVVLKGERSPISRFFLAKAYEGTGDLSTAADILKELSYYGTIYPEIYNRLGMVSGRLGREGEGYEYLGRYYLARGQYRQARTSFEKAVTRYGINSREAKELLRILDEMKEEMKGEMKNQGPPSFRPFP